MSFVTTRVLATLFAAFTLSCSTAQISINADGIDDRLADAFF